ncbi:Ras GTPase-activating protein 1, partial [Operophtera brumata]
LIAEGHVIEPQQSTTGAAAEKIYATLRECRDQIGLKKTKGIKHQGYLNKKSDKLAKKWKALYFVHESLWEREFCFQLVERALPCLSTHTFLSANSANEERAWLDALRPLCVPQQARHHDVPPDVTSFTITVHNTGKRGKDSEVAELTIELSSLANGEEIEEWYPLVGMTPIGEWAVLHAFSECNRGAELARELVCAEVARETDHRAMFRAASLATAVVDEFMRKHCKPFLQAAISETVQKLIDAKQSAELNPTKMDSPDDACNNAEFLLLACPRPVRYLCGCLQRAALAKWANERFVRTRVVSAACVGAGDGGAAVARAALLADGGQVSAEPRQPSREPYMEVVNPFILKNKERMVVFLDQLSNVPDPGNVPTASSNNSDIGLAKTQPAIRKLVTVTEMLTKHKHKYLEMIR